MLILKRRVGERIIVGDPKHPVCIITLTQCTPTFAKIGVLAEDDTPIHREEVADAILNTRSTDDGK